MTALKPIENMTGVKPVASERYPLGHVCGHPECTSTDVTAHHIFPRGKVKGDSWFVQLSDDSIIPHVVPLCGSGTMGHHGDVEEHRGWIKLEDDGFVWYELNKNIDGVLPDEEWYAIGLLNPQPGYGDGKPKRKKAAATTQEKRAKVNFTIKAPAGEDNVIPELVEMAAVITQKLFEAPKLATYYQATHAALTEYVQNHKALLRKRMK